MAASQREPRVLTIIVALHPSPLETSLQILSESEVGAAVIFDDWSRRPDRELPELLEAVVRFWLAAGDLPAVAAATRIAKDRPRARPASP